MRRTERRKKGKKERRIRKVKKNWKSKEGLMKSDAKKSTEPTSDCS
jgi:hypothetical protein